MSASCLFEFLGLAVQLLKRTRRVSETTENKLFMLVWFRLVSIEIKATKSDQKFKMKQLSDELQNLVKLKTFAIGSQYIEIFTAILPKRKENRRFLDNAE